MTDKDVKKISKALDERLKPLVGELAKIKGELSNSKTTQFRNYTELSRIGKDIARIDSTLETINEDLNLHAEKLDARGKKIDAQGRKLDILWEQVEKVTIGLEDTRETLDMHTAVLKRIEMKVEGNYDDIGKTDKILIKAEDRLGIVPPPELTIVR